MKKKVNKYLLGGITPNGVKFPWEYADQQYVQAVTPVEPNTSSSFTPISDTMRNVFSTSQSYHQNPLTRSIGSGGNGFGNFIKGLDNSQLNAGISGIGNLATNAISSANQKYSTVSDARKATAMNTISGAVSGAAAGAMIGGPIGAVVGGAAGLASGLVGGKSKARDASFYEDPTLEYGTGILGSIGRGSARRKYDELKKKAEGNRIAAMTGQEANADWMYDLDSENNVFAANGGDIGDLAWLDDGELFKTPDQQIYSVPEQGKPEDSNLLNIPDGTKVLSDKLKVPGTKETFANMAKRLTSNKSKYNDKYAQGSAEANAINDKIVFDTLFDIQEGMKGGKKEYKANIPAYATGSVVDNDLDPIVITAKRPANVLNEVVVNGINLKDDTKRLNGIPIPDYLQPAYSNLIRLLSSDSKNAIAINSEIDNINRLLGKNNAPKSVRQQWNDVLNQYVSTLGVGASTVQQQMIPDSMRLHIPGTIQSPVTEAAINNIRSNARINTMIPEYTDVSRIGEQYTSVGDVWNTGEQSLRLDDPGVYIPNNNRSSQDREISERVRTIRRNPWIHHTWEESNGIGNEQLNVTDTLDFPHYATVYNQEPSKMIIYEPKRQTSTQSPQTRSTGVRQSSQRSATSRFTLTPQQIQVQGAGLDMLPKPIDTHNIAIQELSTPVRQTQPVTTASNTPDTTETRSPYDWEQLATDITSLLPVFSNLGERPETFASVHNPYTNAALSALGRRRYDIRPTIDAIRRGTASANYAMSQNNVNTGANLAFRLQNAVKANNAITGAYADAAIQNNQYAADYANALNNFGQQYVQARNTAIDQNARSRAQARNINRAGLSQLSNYAQNRLLMRNQRLADQAMLDIYKPILSAGFTPDQYAKLFEQVSRRR